LLRFWETLKPLTARLDASSTYFRQRVEKDKMVFLTIRGDFSCFYPGQQHSKSTHTSVRKMS